MTKQRFILLRALRHAHARAHALPRLAVGVPSLSHTLTSSLIPGLALSVGRDGPSPLAETDRLLWFK